MGFCFYNNVAVAAMAARQEPGIERVLVLDWDVHHGESGQINPMFARVLDSSLSPVPHRLWCGLSELPITLQLICC